MRKPKPSMVWRRTAKGLVQRPAPYPMPTIPEHLVIQLEIAIKENPENAEKIITDFSEIFGVPVDAVFMRLCDGIEALEERETAVLH